MPEPTPSYWRRLFAAIIGLAVFILAVAVLSSIALEPVSNLLLVFVGLALATVCASLGRRVMRVPFERRRGWLWLRASEDNARNSNRPPA
ncbi:MAG: hypothetical protein Kow00120_29040 [Anaerolineae bacterium]